MYAVFGGRETVPRLSRPRSHGGGELPCEFAYSFAGAATPWFLTQEISVANRASAFPLLDVELSSTFMAPMRSLTNRYAELAHRNPPIGDSRFKFLRSTRTCGRILTPPTGPLGRLPDP